MNIFDRLLILLNNRKKAYALTFGGPAGRAVLEDLSVFCHADTTTFDTDARVSAALEGRREVWLRIQQHLGMSADELATLYHAARQPKLNKGD